MKKLLGIALVISMLLVLVSVIPSQAAITERVNVDELSLKTEGGTKVADLSKGNGDELGQIKSYVESGATIIYFNGWYAPPKPLLDIGFQTDDGDVEWGFGKNDGTGSVVAGWVGFDENGLWTLRAAGGIPVQEGSHTYKVVAKFTDGETKVIHSAHYYNDDTVIMAWGNISNGAGIGQWLNFKGAYSAAAFTANAPFEGVRIPVQWSSKISDGRGVTFDLSLFAFNGTVENSLAGTPLATIRVNPDGDQAGGNKIEFDALPAGQYVVAVIVVDGETDPYTVLPESGDPNRALYVNNLSGAQATKTFNFGVKTADPDTFFGEPPRENIALNKPVAVNLNGAAAADRSFWRPEYLTDGFADSFSAGTDTRLGWAFATPAAQSPIDVNAYVDLGAVYSVDAMDVVSMMWSPAATFPGAYTLYVSLDGENWTAVASKGVDANTAGQIVTYNLDEPVEANYVRFQFTENNGTWASGAHIFTGVGDLRVYGTKVRESENADIPPYVTLSYVASRDEIYMDGASVAAVGGNPEVTICPPLKGAEGKEVYLWGWVVSTMPVESFGYSIDGGEIVYDEAFKYPAEQGVIDLGTGWGTGVYGESTRYKMFIPFDTVCGEIRAYVKINGQEFLYWTIKVADAYNNYTGAPDTAPETATGSPSMWIGFTNTLKWQMAFNTDVSFSAINLPQAWAYPGVSLKVTIAKDGHFDDGIVFETVLSRPGDGGFLLDLGQTLPAGQYILKIKITDDTPVVDGGDGNLYPAYFVIGHASDPLGEEYCLNTHGTPAIQLISSDEGQGFIPREVVTRVNVDGASAGGVDFPKTDGETVEIPEGTTSMSFNGWVAANFDIEKYGYRIDDGEVVYDESFKRIEEDADYNAIMGVAHNFFGFDKNGFGYRFVTDGGIPLTDGEHKIELMARINGEDVCFFTYNVKNPTVAEPVEIESNNQGGVAGVWLRTTDDTEIKIEFKTNQAFTAFNIPVYWASNPPQFGDLKANIEVSLYKFDKNLRKTLEGTPVATAKYLENLGDNNVSTPFSAPGTGATLTNYSAANQGFAFILDAPAEAGQYVVVIRNDAGAGSYVVLPSASAADAVLGTDYIKYFFKSDEESFKEAVRFTLTLVDEGAFVQLDPDEADEPDVPNPPTGNALAIFAVIVTLALAAAIVLKKRAF